MRSLCPFTNNKKFHSAVDGMAALCIFLIGTVEWMAMWLWESMKMFSGTVQYHKYFQLCENMDSYVVLGMNINFVMVSEHKKKWCTLQECAIAWMAMTV